MANPELNLIYTSDDLGRLRQVLVEDDYLYVLEEAADVLSIWDVSVPTATTKVGEVDLTSIAANAKPCSMKKRGKYVYITLRVANAIGIVDVSDPTTPVVAGSVIDAVNLEDPHGCDLLGDYMYTANWSSDYFAVVDISNPAAPFVAGSLQDTTKLNGIHDVHVEYPYAWVTTHYSGSDTIPGYLIAIDISDPTTPVIATELLTDTELAHLNKKGRHLFTGGGALKALMAYDAPDPAVTPTLLQKLLGPSAYWIVIHGDYLYVVDAASKLNIVDISDPSDMSIVESWENPDSIDGGVRAVDVELVTQLDLISHVYVSADTKIRIFELITISPTLGNLRIVLGDTDKHIWTSAELNVAIDASLIELSKKQPYIVKETLATVATSRALDMSSITGLLFGYNKLSIDSPKGVEYPVGEYPRRYRNYDIDGTSLVMDIETVPSAAGEDVYVNCLKAHTADTLPPSMEPLAVKLAAAYAAINKPLKFINDFEAETTKFDNITTAIGNMSERITQAIADLTSGRALVGDERESATEAIGDMTARIGQAVADIASARTYFNKANIARPEQEYLASAGQEMSSAISYLNQARGYLAEEGGVSGGYRNQAVAELTGANTYLGQARGYLEHVKVRIANINLTEKYEAWGQRMLAQVQPELRAIARRRVWKEWSKD